MAALVQTIPQQTTTVTLLQPGPSSSSTGSHSHRTSRSLPLNRAMYGGSIGTLVSYRGQNTPAVAPYAFTTTPGLAPVVNLSHGQTTPHLKQEHRTASAPATRYARLNYDPSSGEHHAAESTLATPSSMNMNVPSSGRPVASKDDSSVPAHHRVVSPDGRPHPSLNPSAPGPFPSTAINYTSAKPSPDRYRRGPRRPDPSGAGLANVPFTAQARSALPSGSGMATIGHLYDLPSIQADSSGPSSRLHHVRSTGALGPTDRPSQPRTTSVDDLQLYRQSRSEPPRRYRRQSTSVLDREGREVVRDIHTGLGTPQPDPSYGSKAAWGSTEGQQVPESTRQDLGHRRDGSAESDASGQSTQSRAPSSKNEPVLSPLTPLTSNPVLGPNSSEPQRDMAGAHLSPRVAVDANRRPTSLSPLSRPLDVTSTRPGPSQAPLNRPRTTVAGGATSPALLSGNIDSPAAQQLAELNDKDGKKGVKSRLRRAFSFGSAAELRRASAENNLNMASAERARLRKERYQGEHDAEQAAIAQKQEAAGLGQGIYSGQGVFQSGSTDNLSISSTASSASIMIRKMGKGMKKSTRSLVGLFRPKSVVGAPTADDASVPGASAAQVSMVTVEAEREKVNVNVDPHDQAGGGTGFPRLERNSMDAGELTSAGYSRIARGEGEAIGGFGSRRSIVGGEFERAEVLAAVKKGILKRAGTGSPSSSPVSRPADAKSPDFHLPLIPNINESPHSSAPTTPVEDNSSLFGHRRTDSVRIEGEDYFMSLPKLGLAESKSVPDTPQSIAKFNVSFSPRIQFHDTWPSGEYDRRGETATCNRLTPMLAQQIKEELNTFKMEMEVHEQSKVYTHFF